jgi:5-formyltetrahydrofolate cyclo-ligase
MNKATIRKIFREKRDHLSMGEETRSQDLLLIRFQQLDLPFLQTVHSYLPARGKKEPDPEPILRWLAFRNPGLRVLVPRVNEDMQSLSHYWLEEDTRLVPNAWGIPEPVGALEASAEAVDLVIVPLLAFDRQGQRVGYGKGFYDRFLATCRPETIKLGLSFFEPVERIEDTNTFDVRLDCCVTPERTYAFE